MADLKREKARLDCEMYGIHWGRSRVGDMSDGETAQYTREWIDEYETRERAELERQQLKLASESVAAANISAQAALDSAQHARDSVKITRLAALFALIAAVAAIGQAIASFRTTP